MTKSQQAKSDAIALLIKAGFVPDGDTRTARSPSVDYMRKTADKNSMEWTTSTSRLRFKKVGTEIKATVGARTTFLYRMEGGGAKGVKTIASVDTGDVVAIRLALKGL